MKIVIQYDEKNFELELPDGFTGIYLDNQFLAKANPFKGLDDPRQYQMQYTANGNVLFPRGPVFENDTKCDAFKEAVKGGAVVLAKRVKLGLSNQDEYLDEKNKDVNREIMKRAVVIGGVFMGTALLETVGLVIFGFVSPDMYTDFLNSMSGYTGLVFAALGVAVVAAVISFIAAIHPSCSPCFDKMRFLGGSDLSAATGQKTAESAEAPQPQKT